MHRAKETARRIERQAPILSLLRVDGWQFATNPVAGRLRPPPQDFVQQHELCKQYVWHRPSDGSVDLASIFAQWQG